MRRRNEGQGWDAYVTTATKREYGVDCNRYGKLMEGTVAVRLRFRGKDAMTYATLNISDPNFDDRITTLKAEAEERASSLQAVGAVV